MTVHPGGMREMHWHPNADEWQYYIAGQGAMTVFNTGPKVVTQNFKPGDIGYVKRNLGHFIQNTGDTDLVFLEVFRSNRFEDVSLSDWLGAHAALARRAAPQHRSVGGGALPRQQAGDRAGVDPARTASKSPLPTLPRKRERESVRCAICALALRGHVHRAFRNASRKSLRRSGWLPLPPAGEGGEGAFRWRHFPIGRPHKGSSLSRVSGASSTGATSAGSIQRISSISAPGFTGRERSKEKTSASTNRPGSFAAGAVNLPT